MLHPRSVWSPPTPVAKLPELPRIPDQDQIGGHAAEDGDECRPARRATPLKRTSVSPRINTQPIRGEDSPDTSRDSDEDRLPAKVTSPPEPKPELRSLSPQSEPVEQIVVDYPTPASPPPELLGDMSQETSFSASAPLITPNSSFSVDPMEHRGEEELPSATPDTRFGLCLNPIDVAQSSIIGLNAHGKQADGRGWENKR